MFNVSMALIPFRSHDHKRNFELYLPISHDDIPDLKLSVPYVIESKDRPAITRKLDSEINQSCPCRSSCAGKAVTLYSINGGMPPKLDKAYLVCIKTDCPIIDSFRDNSDA